MTEPPSRAPIADAVELPLAGGLPPLARPPVFLHTGWRTAGTFLWSRFRSLSGVSGYYEPLHESLATVTPATLSRHGPQLWASGHPRLRRPYFDEFAPLLRESAPGVQGYQGAFATDGFFAEADAAQPALRGYLQLLLAAARQRGEQPVLKFCRSLGRAGWMARNFPEAVHIAVVRNPVSQFIAAKHQFAAHDNPYFLLSPLLVLARNAAHAPVAAALTHFAVHLPPQAADEDRARARAALTSHLRRTEPKVWYRGFLAFWLLSMLGIPETIDAIIDADLLSASADYQNECAAELASLSGVAIDLGDAARPACCGGRVADRIGIPRAELWRYHKIAAAFLAERSGPDWVDRAAPANAGALLAQATLLGMDRDRPLRAGARGRAGEWEALATYAERVGADQRRALRRAERAERELAAVYQSRSWKITSPIRLLGRYARLLSRGNGRRG
ncbi:MAG TPA: hypothetical protein VMA86_05735 [Acetobacteraceae bacterium]|nr:hypothetical protein [Acetobacteraceae bacterium]